MVIVSGVEGSVDAAHDAVLGRRTGRWSAGAAFFRSPGSSLLAPSETECVCFPLRLTGNSNTEIPATNRSNGPRVFQDRKSSCALGIRCRVKTTFCFLNLSESLFVLPVARANSRYNVHFDAHLPVLLLYLRDDPVETNLVVLCSTRFDLGHQENFELNDSFRNVLLHLRAVSLSSHAALDRQCYQ